MNEHDSERIAGLLEADGLVPAAIGGRRRRRRAQHLLHPRERRQQALRQPRPPQDVEGRAATGRQIVVAGCLAQKDRDVVRDRAAPRRRRARHPQRPPRRRAAAPRPRTAARSPRSSRRPCSTTTRCSRRPCRPGARRRYNAWVTIQIGCDNSCAFCIVPGRARRGDQPAVRRHRRRGRARSPPRASPRSRCSARTSTATAATSQLAARRDGDADGRGCGRCSPTCCGPSARVDGHPPGALHQPAPQGHAPRDVRRDGRDAGGVRAPALPAAVRLATGCWRRCTAATPPSATSSGSPRPARVVADLAVSTDIIVGFPGETDDDFAATLEVAAEAQLRLRLHVHLLARAPAPRRPSMADRFVDPAVAGERFDRLRVVVERSALAANEARVGRVEEVLVEGPSKQGPGGARRPHPPEQARALHAAARRCAPAPTPTVEITARRAAPPRRAVRRGRSPRPAHRIAHPGRRRA